jgi:formylglycine-generating enzyme required for sulfatase activity
VVRKNASFVAIFTGKKTMPPKPDHVTAFLNDIERALPDHDMVLVSGGAFLMGGQDDEARDEEKPVHEVALSDFSIGKYPVTQALWKAVMGQDNNPSFFNSDHRPVEKVSWDDAQAFIKNLNEKTSRTAPGLVYRLPTEAEWEYAARGGQMNRGYKYAGSDDLKEVGWYWENSHRETKTVGLKYPNELGLYDMSGNVWEWCLDWYGGSKYYEECHEKGLVVNPVGPEEGSDRVLRGGGWLHFSRLCRVASRSDGWPDSRLNVFGFRLVLALQSDGS